MINKKIIVYIMLFNYIIIDIKKSNNIQILSNRVLLIKNNRWYIIYTNNKLKYNIINYKFN
jgi:hypothetical protein